MCVEDASMYAAARIVGEERFIGERLALIPLARLIKDCVKHIERPGEFACVSLLQIAQTQCICRVRILECRYSSTRAGVLKPAQSQPH